MSQVVGGRAAGQQAPGQAAGGADVDGVGVVGIHDHGQGVVVREVAVQPDPVLTAVRRLVDPFAVEGLIVSVPVVGNPLPPARPGVDRVGVSGRDSQPAEVEIPQPGVDCGPGHPAVRAAGDAIVPTGIDDLGI